MIVNKGNLGGYVTAKFHGDGAIHLNLDSATTGANSLGETVHAMHISKVLWSCANGTYFTVSRGANTMLVLGEQGDHDYQGSGIVLDSLGGNPQANVVVSKTGSGPSTLVIKMHKKSTEA